LALRCEDEQRASVWNDQLGTRLR